MSSFYFFKMHVRRDSNPQPAVLETAALPIEPLTYITNFFMYKILLNYFVSLWGIRLLHQGQYFLYSTLPVCFFLFLVVE